MSSNKLSLIRTEFALNRSYLASIRTNAIFIGIAIAIMGFIKEKGIKIGLILLILSLLINIIGTIFYLTAIRTFPEEIKDTRFEPLIYIPFGYALILFIFQILIIYTLYNFKKK